MEDAQQTGVGRAPEPAPAALVRAATCWHRLMAATVLTARLYLGCVSLLAPRLSARRRQQWLNSLRTTRWPEASLQPRHVRLGSSGAQVRLMPHEGEFDFAVLLGGRLDYEREVFEFLEERVSRYDSIIEIGANVGVFTCLFGIRMAESGGNVFAFEPAPKAYARLLENLRLNGLERVRTFNAAVGRGTGFQSFFEPEGHLTNGSLVEDFAHQFSGTVKSRPVLVVDASLLQSLLGGGGRVLVKVDVEGYEAEVIEALAPVLRSHRPDLLLEVLPEYAARIEAALSNAGVRYEYHAITPRGLLAQEALRAVDGRDCFLCPLAACEAG